MGSAEPVCDGVYLVAGAGIFHMQDAMALVIDCGDELVMIDSGAGRGKPVSARSYPSGHRPSPGRGSR